MHFCEVAMKDAHMRKATFRDGSQKQDTEDLRTQRAGDSHM